MAKKNENFYVEEGLKLDKRLMRTLLKLKVLSSEDIQVRLSSLKDLEPKVKKVSMESVAKNS